jgi:hypothetical protein
MGVMIDYLQVWHAPEREQRWPFSLSLLVPDSVQWKTMINLRSTTQPFASFGAAALLQPLEELEMDPGGSP